VVVVIVLLLLLLILLLLLLLVVVVVTFLYRISVGKYEGKELLRRPWSGWKNNIATNLLEL
jgi:hypothetical protein